MDHGDEKSLLAGITKVYLDPDPGQALDQKIIGLIVRETLPWLAGPEVLEMGYGGGQWTGAILKTFGHTNIVDASEELLETARERHGDRVVTHASLFEEFEPPIAYDTIVSSLVLEHVQDPVAVMRGAATWLAPGGRLVAIVPHADSLHRRLGVKMGLLERTTELNATDDILGHRRVYTIRHMRDDIAAAGLRVVDEKGLFVKCLSQSQMVGFSDELLEGFMALGAEIPMEFSTNIAFQCARQA